ncbi:ABC transporter permease [Streptomyces montanisoli]|uniref:Transport permease protein n=1 Tax=Streptomyces montanisoli TaxID=2798581 RepID=A0A940MKV4_9ACTN|nr:ABC transporter permease [Streptomyces montanisoli]MBP0460353.1 ABC transporter permease [Streptomyces montanisoli]
MSTTVTRSTTAVSRTAALARAEVTLLVRNRTALFTALALPPAMIGVAKTSLDRSGATAKTGLSQGELLLTGGVVMVLTLVVYTTLVAAYVSRREELVLKRLRTGEVRDAEILGATAVPAAAIAVVQIALLVALGAALWGGRLPQRPGLMLAGVVLGTVMTAALAAATAAVTRTVESAQVTALPLILVALVGSGVAVPLEVFPDGVAQVLRALPLTPVADLVRGGWVGGMGAGEALRALGTALAWTVLSVFAVRRWFRWEPRG